MSDPLYTSNSAVESSDDDALGFVDEMPVQDQISYWKRQARKHEHAERERYRKRQGLMERLAALEKDIEAFNAEYHQ